MTAPVYDCIMFFFEDENGNNVEGTVRYCSDAEAVERSKVFGWKEPNAKWYQFWKKECSQLILNKYR